MSNGFLRDRIREHCCGECFFWNTAGYEIFEENFDQIGDCERYPPKDEESENSYGYPTTTFAQWCGEFKPNYDYHCDMLTERKKEEDSAQICPFCKGTKLYSSGMRNSDIPYYECTCVHCNGTGKLLPC